ncbi:MAG: AhpC/TSA family protein [Bacteroidetes bacterium]|nr:TlpA family protein disulfide reductase [Bacteroidota bacterium]MBV6460970.1 Thiol-disulfide oxidoreductase ResA [Flavobacteriales bacterium]WKZ75631.1 MAG: TlpA disulfide reductase family protein [Vicingaceae bacterium]MCL4815197.1 TlpA family protein disulfide reductase [Flavobacteriales bacterium]NOG94539.1 AhpC/TSA family protein [Bacteroidota bacterium]
MNKIILSICSLLILFTSCGTDTSNHTIKVTFSNIKEGQTVRLEALEPEQVRTIDSAKTNDKGFVSFAFEVTEKGYFRIKIDNQNFINLILEPNDKVVITGDANNLMDTYTVEGSDESTLLRSYNQTVKANYTQREAINMEYQQQINHPKMDSVMEVLQKKYEAIYEELVSYAKDLISKNPSSFISLAAVEQLDPDKYADYFIKVDEAFTEKYPDSKYFKKFHEKVNRMKKFAVGSVAPDIVLPNYEGNTTTLSSLKGKVILLDFWASWCKPCRAENPNVVKAYNTYQSKGFDVFSVSLDGLPQQQNPKEEWLQAIKQDGLIWKNHVSDMQGWNSPVVPLYDISGIPHTLLIDREGKIIGKNLRGEQLEAKLKEIFG